MCRSDLSLLLAVWGMPFPPFADFTGDGKVDAADLSFLLANWGETPPWLVPVVESITPSSGPESGGTPVTILGSGFVAVESVRIGDSLVSSFTIASPRRIEAVTPSGTAGSVDVVVRTSAGDATAMDGFTYLVPPPTVLEVLPNHGLDTGGDAVVISGAHFSTAIAVRFAGQPAVEFEVIDDETLLAVTPPGLPVRADVAVATAGGSASLEGGFVYLHAPDWADVLELVPDPGVVLDPAMRESILDAGHAWRVRDRLTQIEMLVVPAGSFEMGCIVPPDGAQCAVDSLPVHDVVLTRPFYLARTEVTQAQWTAVVGSNPSQFQGAEYPDAADRPVDSVSRQAAQAFATATGLRLPTEAEWEFACRAGTSTAFHGWPEMPGGTNDPGQIDAIGWSASNSGAQTHLVGQKAANALGFHDMAGNVWEWVNDPYLSIYYEAAPAVDPPGPPDFMEVALARGASWGDASVYLQSAHRGWTDELSTGFDTVGVRPARDVGDSRPPRIERLEPASGPTLGGTRIVIEGVDLVDVTQVTIGGVPASDVVATGGVRVEASTPAGAAGAAEVVVGIRAGATVSWSAFVYLDPPTIAVVDPASGPSSGGTAVAIRGTSLGAVSSVTFGGVAAAFEVVDDSTILATTPPNAVGLLDVEVETPGGAVVASAAFHSLLVPEACTVLEAEPDPAIVYDAAWRAAIRETHLPWRILDERTQVELLLIPPGPFDMGRTSVRTSSVLAIPWRSPSRSTWADSN